MIQNNDAQKKQLNKSSFLQNNAVFAIKMIQHHLFLKK